VPGQRRQRRRTGPSAGIGGPASASRAADVEREAPEPDADPEAIARQICLRLLTTAPRTQAQLAAGLRKRGVPDDAAERVLSRFAEVKLIDDAMFARAWVDSRHHGRGLASRALRAELRQRGVAQDDIQAALSILDPEEELATARELIARRLPGTSGLPAPARMRRLTGVLARKGYPAGLAYRVVREALEGESADGHVSFDELEVLPEPDEDSGEAEAWRQDA
jgi:regulatory protein